MFSKTFQQEIKFSRWIPSFFAFTSTQNILNLPNNFCVILGINILVPPDIDYFVVFTLWLLHGKNGANGRIGRENKLISKLQMGYNPS